MSRYNPFLMVAMLLAVCTSVLALPLQNPPKTETGILFRTYAYKGEDRKYAVYVPRNYDATKKWPMIVFLHGGGECGTDGAKQAAVGLPPAVLLNSEKWPFIILIPQKPVASANWEAYDDMIMGMMDVEEKDYNIDKTMLYLTGLSQGGHGSWMVGAAHPKLWAAIAPICGYGDPTKVGAPLKEMPIWAFHGEADNVVNPEQSKAFVKAVMDAGGTAKLTTYPGVGHNSWDNAYRNEKLWDWFLEHKREQ
ncbi:MAG: prolyl oligopeptidase family serine peptidase [Chthonomonadales bacterium]